MKWKHKRIVLKEAVRKIEELSIEVERLREQLGKEVVE